MPETKEENKQTRNFEIVQSYGGFTGTYTDYSGMYPVSISASGPTEAWVITKLSDFIDKVGIQDGVTPIPNPQPPVDNEEG